ncbi:hypothetical protein MA9V1_156 [Chryseobacterium phage MA9V-1]|nr:hypothetical protein MA9V1_156 [Chryseobacterium phage MA9V-1]
MTNINATERLIAIFADVHERNLKNVQRTYATSEYDANGRPYKSKINYVYAVLSQDVMTSMLEDSKIYDYPGFEFTIPVTDLSKLPQRTEHFAVYVLADGSVINIYVDYNQKPNQMVMYSAEQEYDFDRLRNGSRSNPTLGKVYSKMYHKIVTTTPVTDYLGVMLYRHLNNLENVHTKFYMLISSNAAKYLKDEADLTDQLMLTKISEIKHNKSRFGVFKPKYDVSGYGRKFANILENHAEIQLIECHDKESSINQAHAYPMAVVLTKYVMHNRFDQELTHSPMNPNDHTPKSLTSELIEDILQHSIKQQNKVFLKN